MGYKERRRPIKVGKVSRAVILPKPWLDYHGEKADMLTLLGDAILIVVPSGYEQKAQDLMNLLESTGNESKNTSRVANAGSHKR